MRTVVETGLPKTTAPAELAVASNGMLFTSQFPLRMDGSIEIGSIAVQTRLTMENLKRTVEAAGGTLDDVAQVIVYIVNESDFPMMNEVYRGFFDAPFPNRATVVAKLLEPGMLIEVVAYAHVSIAEAR